MSSSLSKPVLLTKSQFLSLTYHDIFDYPLNGEQIVKWQMVCGEEGEYEAEKTESYYYLPGRADIVMIRRYREGFSREKLKKAKLLANLLGRIPTIKFIGLSGSLAMRNAIRESDIDFLIITQARTLWVTRALVHLFLLLSGRVRWGSGQDSLCLNMWLDVASLVIPKKKRNVYSAHEVLQVVPLVNKERTHEKFLHANKWVGEYWRSSSKFKVQNSKLEKKNKFNIPNLIFCLAARALEQGAYYLQLFYMGRHKTRETVEKNRAFFHPIDWGAYAMKEFENRNEAPTTSRSGYLLPTLRRERNPSEAENSSRSSASLRSRFSAKGDKLLRSKLRSIPGAEKFD